MKTKPWYASKTLIGAAVVAASLLWRQVAGREPSPEEVETLTQWLTTVADTIGLSLVLWGRLAATRRLTA